MGILDSEACIIRGFQILKSTLRGISDFETTFRDSIQILKPIFIWGLQILKHICRSCFRILNSWQVFQI